MKSRIAALALSIAFLAAPSLASASLESCSPCCPKPAGAPCETGDAPCASLAAASCCDVAPALPASPADRAIDLPNLHPAGSLPSPRDPGDRHARLSESGGNLALPASPYRLSVVLQL